MLAEQRGTSSFYSWNACDSLLRARKGSAIAFAFISGFDWDFCIQVLSPMRQGTAGVEPMNQRLQALLNPASTDLPQVERFTNSRPGLVFQQGDKVIQMINNYDREVFNGDSGFIVQVDSINRNLSVEYPETDYERVKSGEHYKLCISPLSLEVAF